LIYTINDNNNRPEYVFFYYTKIILYAKNCRKRGPMKIFVYPVILLFISSLLCGCTIPDSSSNADTLTRVKASCSEGLEIYTHSVSREPGNASAWLVKALYLNDCGGRFEEALECSDKALEIDPDFAEAWFVRGIVLRNLQRYDEANDAFQTAAQINPEFSRYVPDTY
jgi:tetratricopeptide (TPR) repeat protein